MMENNMDSFEITISGKKRNSLKSEITSTSTYEGIESSDKNAHESGLRQPPVIQSTRKISNVSEVPEAKTQEATSTLQSVRQIQVHQAPNSAFMQDMSARKQIIDDREITKKHTQEPPQNKNNRIAIWSLSGIAVVAFVILICLLLPCKHEWRDATCDDARTCELCGDTEGEALGHAWIDATCTSARTCKTCGTLSGSPKGHRWTEDVVYDYVGNTITTYSVCSSCKTREEKNSVALTTLLSSDGKTFLIPPLDFAARLNAAYERDGTDLSCEWSDWIDTLDIPGVIIKNQYGTEIGYLGFYNDTDCIAASSKTKESAYYIMNLFVFNGSDAVPALAGFVMACNPQHDTSSQYAINILGHALASEYIVDDNLIYLSEGGDVIQLLVAPEAVIGE